jgi:hypothetical protein
MREISPDDVREFIRSGEQTCKALNGRLDHLGRLFIQSEEVVIEERSLRIVAEAQRDKLLAENTRLKEQNARQCKTITESDIAVENAAVRLRWFQAKVTELLEQARIRSASAARLKGVDIRRFEPTPGRAYVFMPKTAEVSLPDGFHSLSYPYPRAVILTF